MFKNGGYLGLSLADADNSESIFIESDEKLTISNYDSDTSDDRLFAFLPETVNRDVGIVFRSIIDGFSYSMGYCKILDSIILVEHDDPRVIAWDILPEGKEDDMVYPKSESFTIMHEKSRKFISICGDYLCLADDALYFISETNALISEYSKIGYRLLRLACHEDTYLFHDIKSGRLSLQKLIGDPMDFVFLPDISAWKRGSINKALCLHVPFQNFGYDLSVDENNQPLFVERESSCTEWVFIGSCPKQNHSEIFIESAADINIAIPMQKDYIRPIDI